MADTYLSLRVHLVWATKNRRPRLDPEWRPRLFACASNIVERKGGKLLCAGGARDHVHLYLEHPGTVPVSEIVTTIKTNTSRWVHQTFPHRKGFQWQHGYGAFTVTAYDDEPLKEFIRNQDLHHRERAYTGEILGLLERHGITYDAVHVLD
jgi:REP element-mobilizing transposase RayT